MFAEVIKHLKVRREAEGAETVSGKTEEDGADVASQLDSREPKEDKGKGEHHQTLLVLGMGVLVWVDPTHSQLPTKQHFGNLVYFKITQGQDRKQEQDIKN